MKTLFILKHDRLILAINFVMIFTTNFYLSAFAAEREEELSISKTELARAPTDFQLSFGKKTLPIEERVNKCVNYINRLRQKNLTYKSQEFISNTINERAQTNQALAALIQSETSYSVYSARTPDLYAKSGIAAQFRKLISALSQVEVGITHIKFHPVESVTPKTISTFSGNFQLVVKGLRELQPVIKDSSDLQQLQALNEALQKLAQKAQSALALGAKYTSAFQHLNFSGEEKSLIHKAMAAIENLAQKLPQLTEKVKMSPTVQAMGRSNSAPKVFSVLGRAMPVLPRALPVMGIAALSIGPHIPEIADAVRFEILGKVIGIDNELKPQTLLGVDAEVSSQRTSFEICDKIKISPTAEKLLELRVSEFYSVLKLKANSSGHNSDPKEEFNEDEGRNDRSSDGSKEESFEGSNEKQPAGQS